MPSLETWTHQVNRLDKAKSTGKMPGSRTRYVSPLSQIEFDAASDIFKYADTLRQLGRCEQLELHTAADELQAVLERSTGNIFERVAAKRKARKIANRLRKAADHARGMSVCGVQLARAFKMEYAAALNPPKRSPRKVLDWKA